MVASSPRESAPVYWRRQSRKRDPQQTRSANALRCQIAQRPWESRDIAHSPETIERPCRNRLAARVAASRRLHTANHVGFGLTKDLRREAESHSKHDCGRTYGSTKRRLKRVLPIVIVRHPSSRAAELEVPRDHQRVALTATSEPSGGTLVADLAIFIEKQLVGTISQQCMAKHERALTRTAAFFEHLIHRERSEPTFDRRHIVAPEDGRDIGRRRRSQRAAA